MRSSSSGGHGEAVRESVAARVIGNVSFRVLARCCLPLSFLVAGCGLSGGMSPVQSTHLPYAPTPTLTTAHTLDWQAHATPVSLLTTPTNSRLAPTLALAESDSHTAYECAPTNFTATGAEVWVTHDQGAHWLRRSNVITGGEVDYCAITVDSLNSATAVALTVHYVHDNCMACFNGTYLSYVTFDSGATWTPERGTYEVLSQVATWRGATYALFQPHPVDLASLLTTLVVSHDGMRTWTPIDRALTGVERGRYAVRFWLNPASGELLAQTQTDWGYSDQFWTSMDGGAHWARMQHVPAADDFFVQQPTAEMPWHICGDHTSGGNVYPIDPNLLSCTVDGGRTWAEGGGADKSLDIVGIADDGSVLAVKWTRSASGELSRLPPRASQWQPLGPVPQGPPNLFSTFIYVSGSGQGMIWGVPQENGDISESQTQIFTAGYP